MASEISKRDAEIWAVLPQFSPCLSYHGGCPASVLPRLRWTVPALLCSSNSTGLVFLLQRSYSQILHHGIPLLSSIIIPSGIVILLEYFEQRGRLRQHQIFPFLLRLHRFGIPVHSSGLLRGAFVRSGSFNHRTAWCLAPPKCHLSKKITGQFFEGTRQQRQNQSLEPWIYVLLFLKSKQVLEYPITTY